MRLVKIRPKAHFHPSDRGPLPAEIYKLAKNSLNVLPLPLSMTTDRLHLLVFGKKRGSDHPRFLFLDVARDQGFVQLEILIYIET